MMKKLPIVFFDVAFDAEKLVRARTESGLTAKEVADSIGISPQRLCNYESGTRHPDAEILLRLCIFYNLDIVQLADVSEKTLQKFNRKLDGDTRYVYYSVRRRKTL